MLQQLPVEFSAIIAQELDKTAYGLVFGANSFFALILQTALTYVFVDKNFFGLRIQQQVGQTIRQKNPFKNEHGRNYFLFNS